MIWVKIILWCPIYIFYNHFDGNKIFLSNNNLFYNHFDGNEIFCDNNIFVISFSCDIFLKTIFQLLNKLLNVIFLLLRLTTIKAKMHKNGPYPVPLKMLSNTHFLTDFQKLNCRRKMRTRAKSVVLWKKNELRSGFFKSWPS